MDTNQLKNSNITLLFLCSHLQFSYFLFFLFCFACVSAQTVQNINFPDIPVKGYGDTSFVLNASSSSGAITYTSSDTTVATISGNTVTIRKIGFSFISAFVNGIGTNASAAPVAQLLVVCPKATLTVKADDKIIAVGADIPAFNYTTTGFKNSQNTSVITGTPTLSTAGNNLVAGAYPIVINRNTMAATNYEFMMEDGTLVVNPSLAKSVFNSEVSEMKIFSNSGSNIISFVNAGKASISIIDMSGKTVLQTTCYNDLFSLDISGLSCGIYILRTLRDNETQNTKFIISR